jgi:hypothetical protein
MSSSLPFAGPVNVIDPVILVDAHSSASKPSAAITVEITPTVAFPCTATITSTMTDTITAPRMTMLRATAGDQSAPGRMTMMRRPA